MDLSGNAGALRGDPRRTPGGLIEFLRLVSVEASSRARRAVLSYALRNPFSGTSSAVLRDELGKVEAWLRDRSGRLFALPLGELGLEQHDRNQELMDAINAEVLPWALGLAA